MTINLKYNQLNKILNNNSEIHFIIDSDNFFDENNIDMSKFKKTKQLKETWLLSKKRKNILV